MSVNTQLNFPQVCANQITNAIESWKLAGNFFSVLILPCSVDCIRVKVKLTTLFHSDKIDPSNHSVNYSIPSLNVTELSYWWATGGSRLPSLCGWGPLPLSISLESSSLLAADWSAADGSRLPSLCGWGPLPLSSSPEFTSSEPMRLTWT